MKKLVWIIPLILVVGVIQYYVFSTLSGGKQNHFALVPGNATAVLRFNPAEFIKTGGKTDITNQVKSVYNDNILGIHSMFRMFIFEKSLKDPKNVGLDYNSDIVLFNTKLEGVEFRALLIRMKNMDDFHRVILKKNNIEMALRRTADFYFLDDMEGSTVAWNEDGILFLDKVNRYNF